MYRRLIKEEIKKIRTKYCIDLSDSVIILEVLRQFNLQERTFFTDIENRKVQEYLFAIKRQEAAKKLYELTGRLPNEVTKPIQETSEWQYSMQEYFST